MIHSTQPNVQTAKNIEVTSSTTKREIIEVTQIVNTQTARLAKIELLNKLNNNKLNTNTITAILAHNLPDPDETKCLRNFYEYITNNLSNNVYHIYCIYRNLTAVGFCLTAVRFLTSIRAHMSNPIETTNHDTSVLIVTEHSTPDSSHSKRYEDARSNYSPIHTPYGPYNLPHMVLCTQKGPVNA